ncbi:sugar phosphate isomerase/epimerase family protein [Candidatus Hydrogenedentota bacterium]
MRLGGPVFNPPEDPVELARAHVEFGYSAAFCPQIPLSDTARISAIRKAFADEGVVIAEAGAWCNLITPDEQKRGKNFKYVCERLALADEIGALCCVDFIGTLDPDSEYGPHPENLSQATFDLAVETVRKVLNEVRPKNAKFCLEMMQWTYPDTPDSYLRLIEAVDHPSFAVHLDPVNLIVSPQQYFDNGALIRECFDKLGKWIVSCHAKDIILRNKLSLHLDETIPGTGNLDYRTYLSQLRQLPGDVPIMLEHLSSMEEYAQARNHLRKIDNDL